ncbi:MULTISPECIES: hypothetical protein [Kitasatospora]|uniref:Uncharacterized protein n=1 Tax=Kitasatospora setae (strain ATCC 33774 / DSM 43861 / JCM 3304 / KCC A-0304 / NBRC 14216 / KM-6054) TaxID=452652 RepID=E4N791_KITSK|nr:MULTISPECIES: hypothetical protein [Kitasatospora]BAJ27072.1 hypothetical protein KSE_12390 [Kitasatospora setae KM-6054]
MNRVEYYPQGYPGLDWMAVGDDLDGVVLATSDAGVAIARATDPRTVLVVNPDEWADLRYAIKRGLFDHLLGDRLLCADPTPRPPVVPGERVYVVVVDREGTRLADATLYGEQREDAAGLGARVAELLRRGAYEAVPGAPR